MFNRIAQSYIIAWSEWAASITVALCFLNIRASQAQDPCLQWYKY